jgi:hypothetical protein
MPIAIATAAQAGSFMRHLMCEGTCALFRVPS